MCIFVARRLDERFVVGAQKIGQTDLHRQIAAEAADAVLALHPSGKRQADAGRVQAEKPVETVIFFP